MVEYCDADWANDLEDKRSTTRVCIHNGRWSQYLLELTTHNHIVNNPGLIHGKCTSYQGNHMDDKVHEGIRVNEREEGDGDLM